MSRYHHCIIHDITLRAIKGVQGAAFLALKTSEGDIGLYLRKGMTARFLNLLEALDKMPDETRGYDDCEAPAVRISEKPSTAGPDDGYYVREMDYYGTHGKGTYCKAIMFRCNYEDVPCPTPPIICKAILPVLGEFRKQIK